MWGGRCELMRVRRRVSAYKCIVYWNVCNTAFGPYWPGCLALILFAPCCLSGIAEEQAARDQMGGWRGGTGNLHAHAAPYSWSPHALAHPSWQVSAV